MSTRRILLLTGFFSGRRFAKTKDPPVKVCLLAGQPSMVGIGLVAGGGSRWGNELKP
ncbi:MAG: hypothetical protein OSB05_08825 [Akkermansiaceae bacterium]|nr:hypothetical protein [Akkermansiaceae bacterium]